MQRDGERAGLEGVVLLWGTERTYVIAAPSSRKALERFREVKQRLSTCKPNVWLLSRGRGIGPAVAVDMATWIPEMVELLKAVDRSPTPPGNINCATYLAAVDNISKVCAAAQET